MILGVFLNILIKFILRLSHILDSSSIQIDIHSRNAVKTRCQVDKDMTQGSIDMCTTAVEDQLDDVLGESEEPVMVCDQTTKVVKEVCHQPYWNKGSSNRELPYRYSPAIDEILFGYSKVVRALRMSSKEISHVYQLSTSELKAQYTFQSNRLLSYETEFTSHHMTAIALANAGLINFKKDNDAVVCVWCSVQFRNFKQSLDATALHMAYSEEVCDFIKNYNRLNISLTKVNEGNPQRGYLDLGNGLQGFSKF